MKKTVLKKKAVVTDPSKNWRIATIALLAITLFMFFFNVDISLKANTASNSGVKTQGVQRAPSAAVKVAPPQGGGGCGI